MQIVLLPEYAYVIYTFVASIFFLFYLGARVGMARKEYKVDYPTMYDNEKPGFNSVQRGHQNFLESYPFYLGLLFIGGIQYPVLSAGAGAIHLVGRFMYAYGYSTGDVRKRSYGAIFIYPSLIAMIYATVQFALSL
jgi:glutathione S-transferase